MKEANLLSLVSAFKTLEKNTFDNYLKYHSISFRENEITDLISLVYQLQNKTKIHQIFEGYFIGFSIPQISKEFDLLRIGQESIINIELKNSNTNEKIEKQLIQNQYYLKFLQKKIYLFTYVKEEKKLYTLSNDNKLVETDIISLVLKLANQKAIPINDISQLFKATDYLVSPFNSTSKFIEGEYFLTSQQEDIKRHILNKFTTSTGSLFTIKGSAGTGKTLLTYDIASEINKTNSTLIIHCGLLNPGQVTLKEKYNWDIVSIRQFKTINFSNYNNLIIDEAQRIYSNQLSIIIGQVLKGSKNCILAYDAQQTLSRDEVKRKFEDNILTHPYIQHFELTKKIRTNKEVSAFILNLIYKNSKIEKYNYNQIEIKYFQNIYIAKEFLLMKKDSNWKLINFTPSRISVLPYDRYIIDDEDNAHKVIGQEFDNVIAVIDQHFYYKKGVLSTKNYNNRPYYHPTKMLYQIMSRARCKLCIVIINNPEVLERCLEILNTKES